MRKKLEELDRWTLTIEGYNLDLINPNIRYVLQEIIKLLDEALPKEKESDEWTPKP